MVITQECIDFCQTPNGCDCFGCCTVAVDGMSYNIYVGDAECSLDAIETCEQCTPSDDCNDPCIPGECEVCFAQDLPPGCDDPTCDGGGGIPCKVDDMGSSNCPVDMFCSTGCCSPIVPGSGTAAVTA